MLDVGDQVASCLERRPAAAGVGLEEGRVTGGQPPADSGLLVEHALVRIPCLAGQRDVGLHLPLADEEEESGADDAQQQDGEENTDRGPVAALQLVHQTARAAPGQRHGDPLDGSAPVAFRTKQYMLAVVSRGDLGVRAVVVPGRVRALTRRPT